MQTNIVLSFDAMEFKGDPNSYSDGLDDLLLLRDLACTKADLFYKPGNWNDEIFAIIANQLQSNDSRVIHNIKFKLRLLFDNRKSIALGTILSTHEDLFNYFNNDKCAYAGLNFEYDDIRNIRNCKDWYSFHRMLLVKYPPTVEEFCSELSPYFENLYFNRTSVPQFLPTLHCGSHIPMMATIIHHLTALNTKFYSLFARFRTQGLPVVCNIFQIEMDNNPIPFGCSTDKDSVQSLDIEFICDITGESRYVYCDPHTKIWDYLEDSISGHQGDRIYFSQPLDDFIKNRILIARIGKHRESN